MTRFPPGVVVCPNLTAAAAAVVIAFSSACSRETGARVEIDQASLDVGTVVQGVVVRRSFVIRSAGAAPLDVRRAQAECHCTSVMPVGSPVAPGSFAEVVLEFDSAAELPGSFDRGVVLSTNDPGRGSVRLSVKGTVEPELKFSAAALDFGANAAGSPPIEIDVEVLHGHDVQVEDATVRNASVTASVGLARPGVYRLRVVPVPSGVPHFSNGAVVLRTSSKAMPQIRLPVRGIWGMH